MRIRSLEPQDNEAIEKIIRQCLTEFGGNREGLAWADASLSDLYRFYQPTGSETDAASAGKAKAYWVAEEDGRVLGGCGIAPFADSGEVCELQKMYLLPEARRTGAGSLLLQAALDFAERHYKACYLETLGSMAGAHRFYEKHGFRSLPAPLPGSEHYACDVWYIQELPVPSREIR
ncbi:GNAT family N-acetyltransferase [Gorillibacterium sp. sgz500922]|uniref:GNAT family N-acetyltransferase n=1 Tax=Gorillibacterium sp. sgz500922 TaxID=3446694 RepID=UPI003F666F54